MWWLWKVGAVWLTEPYNRVWGRHLLRDPRPSLCIEATEPVPGHVEFDGVAEPLHPGRFDIWPISRELVEKEIGRGDPGRIPAVESFLANMRTEPRVLFGLVPSSVRAIDAPVYRGKRADREYQAGAGRAAAEGALARLGEPER